MKIHIIHNGEQRGPYSIAEINWDLAREALPADTLAWHAGLTDWTPIRNISGIKPLQNQSATAARVVPHQSILSASHATSAKKSTFAFWLIMIFSVVGTWVAMAFLSIHMEERSRRQSVKSNFERVEATKAAQAFEEASRLEEREQRTNLWENREIISVEEISGGMETKTETQTRTVSRPFVVKSGKKFGIGLMPINEDVEKPKTTYRRTQYRVTYFSENSETKQIVTLDYNPLRYQ